MTHERLPSTAGPRCLGVGSYAVNVVARRTPTHGPRPVAELPVTSGNFTRVVDSISSGQFTMPLTIGCAEALDKVQPLRHEVEVWRNNDLVWCGPIIDLSVDEDANTASVSCNDLAYWFNLRVFRHTMEPRDIDIAEIFQGYCDYALGRGLPEWGTFFPGDPPTGRVLADGKIRPPRPTDPPLYEDDFGLKVEVSPVGVTGDRTVYKGDLKVVYSELEELAQTGVDFTVVNRTMMVGGGEVTDDAGATIILPGRFTDESFDQASRLRRTAEGMATEVLTRGNGVRSRVGGPDSRDGIEVTRVLDEYSIEDQASADAAAQSYFDRGKNPLDYVEGAGALTRSSPVQFQQLIPGARVRVLFEGSGITLDGGMRLDSLSVSWDENGEQVTPTFQPLGTAGADARGQGG